ncbi:hypothetical protein U1Q18_009217 [Sarracenia purpurea var. burkii]
MAPTGGDGSVFIENPSLEAFERALTTKDKEIMQTFSLEEAIMKKREYYSAWKAVERRLHHATINLSRTHEQVGTLELDVRKVKVEAEHEAEG